MKYVVFKHDATDQLMPVIFPEHITHADVTIEGALPVSAGFVYVDSRRRVTIPSNIKATSLDLGPKDIDTNLIRDTLNNSGIYAFSADPNVQAIYNNIISKA
ncbi:MAG: hypothetical protein ABW007_19170 [Chitinophagaceae bacterium]